MSGRVPEDLLEILVCPRCKGDLELRRDAAGEDEALLCGACGLAYPIEDGIPVMLEEEAQPIGAGRPGDR